MDHPPDPTAVRGQPAPASSVPDGSAGDPTLRVFAYAVADKAWLYVSVVDALMAAKERFTLQLRPAEVARVVPEAGEHEVAGALEALERWGNVQRFYDTAAPETLDQFYAKRFLYQLTEAGVAAHQGVRAVRRAGLDGGRLSAVLLPGIIERLAAVQAEATGSAPDGARLYRSLVDLFGTFTELADNAARYMNDLAVETTAITADDDAFVAYKRAVFTYLDEFVARLADATPRIAAAITELDPAVPDLIAIAAAADAAPVRDGEDDGVQRTFTARWSGVRAWFVAGQGEEPIVDSLRSAMIGALNRILVAIGRLHERHLRRVTREADFTQLARWFAVAAPGRADLLWDEAFGLYPARHFAELAGDEEQERGRSFWDAEPAEVAPRLRAAGTRTGGGRVGRAADYSAAKAAGLARLRAQHRQARLATERLAARTPARLSDLGLLDPDEFAQFLALIDAALSVRPGADGSRTAATPLVTVTVRPIRGPEVPPATVVTPAGRLRCTDQVLEVAVAGAGREAVAREGWAG
ncbi:MAG TPA: TIGR02677 family protein [Acidimicrobiales bacterium]|nr:TIGR02677 family protein [Acidimicrobiales bacterium]